MLEDHQFQALVRTIGRDDLVDDPRCRSLATRVQHALELFQILGSELAKRTTAELVERARKFERRSPR